MQIVARFILTYRRPLLALLAGLIVWSTLSALTAGPDTTPVVVAARDLASGERVKAGDLTVLGFAPETVPDGILTATEISGRTIAAPMRKGEPFTDRRIAERRPLEPGRSLAVVEIPLSLTEVVRAGDSVDVVATTGDGIDDFETLAKSARVVHIQQDTQAGSATVTVDVKTKTASRIARATSAMLVTVIPVAVP